MLISYRGSYAGVEGTLRTRVANATDKAMLLAILLQKMKIKVRMARSDWPEGAVPHQGPGPRRPLPALDKLAELVQGDAAGANSPASTLTDKRLQDLRDEITASEDATRRVLTTIGRGDFLDGSPAPGDTAPGRVDTNWVWVQAQLDGKTWTDLDPVFPKRDRPARVQAPYGFMPVAVTVRV